MNYQRTFVWPYQAQRTKKLSLKSQILNRIPERQWHKGSIERQHYFSQALNNSRDIDVYLPPSYYHDYHKAYPVVYMHDGNNLFYPNIAFGGLPWKADRMIERLVNHQLMNEVIVVGVFNTPGRHYEYTWTPMKYPNGAREGGGGAKYGQFLTQELKPFIDRKYRTLPSRENTAVMGSSMGGLISFYLGLHHPEVFSKIGVLSPSLWWDYGIIFKDARYLHRDMMVWLDMGTREGYSRVRVEHNRLLLATRKLKSILEEGGYCEGLNLGYLEDRGGHHNEHYWGQRLHLPLLFFFGKKPGLIFSKER